MQHSELCSGWPISWTCCFAAWHMLLLRTQNLSIPHLTSYSYTHGLFSSCSCIAPVASAHCQCSLLSPACCHTYMLLFLLYLLPTIPYGGTVNAATICSAVWGRWEEGSRAEGPHDRVHNHLLAGCHPVCDFAPGCHAKPAACPG